MRQAEELPSSNVARVARVTELLGVMLSRGQAERPFLIVSDLETERFVQFAGSREEPLLIDCPRLDYQKRFPGVHRGKDLETVAANALDLLTEQLGHARRDKARWLADLQWTDTREMN